MKSTTLCIVLVMGGMAGTAAAECTEQDGYVFVFSQCQQQQATGSLDLCQHAPGHDPKFMYFVSNVVRDTAADRSSLGSLFYHVIGAQHDVAVNGTSSRCFDTPALARTHRAQTIERYRGNFENVVVKDVTLGRD